MWMKRIDRLMINNPILRMQSNGISTHKSYYDYVAVDYIYVNPSNRFRQRHDTQMLTLFMTPLISFYLYPVNNGIDLHISCHHLLCSGQSMMMIGYQLTSNDIYEPDYDKYHLFCQKQSQIPCHIPKDSELLKFL